MESVSEGGEGREGSEVKRGARVGEGRRGSARVGEGRRGSVRVGECRAKSSSFFISTMKYLIFKHFSICAPFSHFII